MKKLVNLLAVLFFLLFVGSVSANDKILGTWITEGGKSNVELYKCGGNVCGKIVWLKEPNYKEGDDQVKKGQVKAGDPKVDTENPDASKKKNPIVGLEFLKNFKYDAGDEEFVNGEIYDPESGKLYVGELKLVNDNTLKLNGHLKISRFLGKKQTWKRK
ncbi:MAG: DUF2147 domain-containing protein [Leptospiraceae bacterium]|nr:DUF2147 domain-containing protein [Leptospiraceae bacterium]MCP5510739.1 DUF2147 domain-containing protein [Leptospiraceae bacterium]